ncbi:MAG: 50S ribosomal protein L11 methyltransferase [Dehalococcoidia bacterium]|nr:50S ribosomal protein L11 methyltransferase [Dehalococcoidia bacterium]
MRYIELSVAVAHDEAEAAADALRIATGAGIEIDRPFTQPDLESGAVPQRGGVAHVRAYVAASAGRAMRRAAQDALAAAGIAAAVGARSVDEEDWAEAWKEHFHVERFGRVVVVPSWRAYEATADDVVITLDPGMAFGTGQHETTRMCLEALAGQLRPGERVLDAGCGSGILAVAAAKLGAADVLAVDIDADCVRIAGENARANGVDARVTPRLVAAGDSDWPATGSFDLVVANIIAATIIELAPAFARALAPGGRLIASGIIAAREHDVSDALTSAGFPVLDVRAMAEWRCVQAIAASR